MAPASAPEQMALWDEGADAGAEEGEKQKITYERKKKSAHAGRQPLPDHLPVDEVIIGPGEATGGMKRIGEEITDTLDYNPGSLRIKRTIRPKEVEGEATVIIAPLPARVIEKGIPEPGLPVYNALLDWVIFAQANNLSKGDIGKALKYARDQLPKLRTCFVDGRLELDNNLIENSIRPLALGRKNYLFAGSHPAAKRAAMMYSFFASGQKLGVNPTDWLKDVLTRLPSYPVKRLEELLPGEWKKSGEV